MTTPATKTWGIVDGFASVEPQHGHYAHLLQRKPGGECHTGSDALKNAHPELEVEQPQDISAQAESET